VIETDRLILREWRDADLVPFNAMCSDPQVMEHLGPLQSLDDTRAAIGRQTELHRLRGHCFWALERRADAAFLGFCGLKIAPPGIPGLADAIEIGWRLRRDAWGFGYAREAAEASLAWGFANLPINRIVAITTPDNHRSWALMLRLGMERRHDLDFAHPTLAPDDRLSAHITYEMRRAGVAP
jgi:RimJ/RimL family protein N-acetyltransferase